MKWFYFIASTLLLSGCFSPVEEKSIREFENSKNTSGINLDIEFDNVEFVKYVSSLDSLKYWNRKYELEKEAFRSHVIFQLGNYRARLASDKKGLESTRNKVLRNTYQHSIEYNEQKIKQYSDLHEEINTETYSEGSLDALFRKKKEFEEMDSTLLSLMYSAQYTAYNKNGLRQTFKKEYLIDPETKLVYQNIR